MKKLIFFVLLFIATTLNAIDFSSIPRDNLVGYWSLNYENSDGTTIFDLSGNANDGTSANTPVFGVNHNGYADGAMTFNGTSDKITLDSNVTISSSYSICWWSKINDNGYSGIIGNTANQKL